MKAYTNIDQSKILAEILSPENADMCYPYNRHLNEMYGDIPYVMGYKKFNKDTDIPCWSLAALLDILSNGNMLVKTTDGEYYCLAEDVMTKHYNNPVDACVDMIFKFKEKNLI